MTDNTLQSNKWSSLMNTVSKLRSEQREKGEQYERERKSNIEKRYAILKEALATGYAPDMTLAKIAELGAEFEWGKAEKYLGGEPFNDR